MILVSEAESLENRLWIVLLSDQSQCATSDWIIVTMTGKALQYSEHAVNFISHEFAGEYETIQNVSADNFYICP